VAQTRERDEAMQLAKVDSQAALDAARRISEPWFRCQALAGVARYAPNDSVALRVAEEASRGAEEALSAYEPVAAVAWPVRALVERGYAHEAESMMRRALVRSEQIANHVSRVDALFLLVQAGWAARGDAWISAVAHLVAATRTASSWKVPGVLRDLVLMLAGSGRDFGPTLANMPEGKHRRQAENRLAAKEFMKPRDFFW
jgi:hypothetical protein